MCHFLILIKVFFFIDATIIELQKEVTKLLSSADELELMRNCKDEYEKADKENGRYLMTVVLKTFIIQCLVEVSNKAVCFLF